MRKPSIVNFVASREEARPAEPGNGHRTTLPSSECGRTGKNSWFGELPRSPPPGQAPRCFHFLALPRPVSEGAYITMGWQQYSRILGLSRGYPYILYLKQLTARVPDSGTAFPQRPGGNLPAPVRRGSGALWANLLCGSAIDISSGQGAGSSSA